MRGYGCNNGEMNRQPGTQGDVNGRSIQSVQIPRHPGCWWVCILADKETMRLSTVAPFPRCSMTLSLMGNFDFFFKEKFPNLSKGMVAQVAGRVIMAYQKARDTRAKDCRARRNERKADVYTGAPLKERLSRLTFLPKEMSLSLVHTAPSPHIWTMVPSLRRCRFHSENERQAVSHELVSFPSFFFWFVTQ